MKRSKNFISNLQLKKNAKKVPEPEILQEFAGADLGDGRLERRLLDMVGEFNANPSAGTINSTMETWASSKGAYRFLRNENVKAEKLIRPHILQTQKRMEQYEYVIAVSDTSYINYNNLKKTEGLGSIGRYTTGKNHSQGIIHHMTYAISPEGLPLGIQAIKTWTRPPEGYASAETRKENKESERWAEQMLEAKKVYPKNTKMIYVADRESDIYELFETAKKEEIDFVVRSKHNRKIEGDRANIKTALSQEEPKGEISVDVTGVSTGKERKKREAVLEIKSLEVHIADSANAGKDAADRKYEKLNVVSVEEKNPPSEKDKIEWRLLTTLTTETAEECVKVVEIYRERWKIELFFKVMKSGCSVERCRLQNADAIIRYIFIMSVISWKIAWMIYVNRTNPSGHYSLVVTELEYKTLWLIRNRDKIKSGKCGKDPPDSEEAWTVRDTVRAMAKIAGFNGRKGDGEPGMQKIWQGWVKLQNALLVSEVFL